LGKQRSIWASWSWGGESYRSSISPPPLRDPEGKQREPVRSLDQGQLATIGRKQAVLERGGIKLGGFLAWWA